MGNSLGSKKAARIMKINGETLKLKTPLKAGAVVRDHPGHVLLDSEAVKHFGIRAQALEPHENLKPKRLYFMVEPPPKTGRPGVPRRVRSSGIQMGAKERLENLMLSRRCESDHPEGVLKKKTKEEERERRRIKLKLPKAVVEKAMKESKSETEVAQKIVDLYFLRNGSMKPTKK